MFNRDDDYRKATQYAQVNTHAEIKKVNGKLIVANFVLLSLLGYLGFSYIQNQISKPSLFNSSKTAVLGVSKTIEDDEYTDEELLKILKVVDVDSVKEQRNQVTINNSMKLLMNESSIQSQSSYTTAISQQF